MPADVHPNFFLVGAPKCGTTSMYHYLRAHPDVFLPEVKEPNFFAPDLLIRSYKETHSLSEYLALYDSCYNERAIGDASQFHLYSRVAASRIKAFSPHAKIIIMLRDPIDLIQSLHAQYVKTADEDELNLAQAIPLNSRRLRGLNVPKNSLFPRCMSYIDVATLTPQVRRYINTFGAQNVQLILLDDLKQSPEATYRSCLSFLGLSTAFSPEFQPHNQSVERQRIPEELRTYLEQKLRPDVLALEALTGRQICSWATAISTKRAVAA